MDSHSELELELVERVKDIMEQFKPTPSEADRIFDLVESRGEKYLSWIKSSVPSEEDKQKVYNL